MWIQRVSIAHKTVNPIRRSLQKSISKFGEDKVELEHLDRKYIRKLRTLKPNGYNLTQGRSMASIPCRTIEITSLELKFGSISNGERTNTLRGPINSLVIG